MAGSDVDSGSDHTDDGLSSASDGNTVEEPEDETIGFSSSNPESIDPLGTPVNHIR